MRLLAHEIARCDELSRSDPAGDLAQRLTRNVGEGQVHFRQRVGENVREADLQLDTVRRGVGPSRRDGRFVEIQRRDGSVAELRRRDREDARATAEVEQRNGVVLEEKAQTKLRGGMGTRPERETGIDDDGDEPLVWVLPRRADPEPADPDRLMELLPSLAPAGLDVGGRSRAENLPETLLAASASSTSTSAITSAPRARREPPPPKRSSPKKTEKRSAMFAKSKSLGRNPPVRSPSCP